MLQEKWFANPRFEMFEDYGSYQSFYNTENGIIYTVNEFADGEIEVREITEDSCNYKIFYERYKTFKQKKYKVTLYMTEEYTIEADTKEQAEKLAREKLGNDYYIDEVIVEEV